MDIYPKLSYKQIGQCKSGELVLIARSSSNHWAFIIENNEERGVVILTDLPDNSSPSPYYILPYDAKERVLSFGKDWRIKINPDDTANVKLNARLSYKWSGVLVIVDERHLLYVRSFNPYNGKPAYIDLASGRLIESPKGSVAIFLKWSLLLHMGSDRFHQLPSFSVEAEV